MSPAYLRIIAGGLERGAKPAASSPSKSAASGAERLSASAKDTVVVFHNSAITTLQQAQIMLPRIIQTAKQYSPGQIHANLNSQRVLELLVP